MDWKMMVSKLSLVFLLYLTALGCADKKSVSEKIKFNGEPSIRVLLSSASGKVVEISTSGPYRILDAGENILIKGKSLSLKKVRVKKQDIFFGRKFHGKEMYLSVEKGAQIQVNQRKYHGEIHCLVGNSGKLRVVNIVPIEKYLACVLGGEMPLSSPASSLQAQAIIARSYAIYEKTHRKKGDFDVYDTVQSQVYKGLEMETPYARAIVKKTRGMVLLYQNALFKTFFHSTCGGHTANVATVFDYPDITPLSGRKCSFCTAGKYYNWEYRADLAALNMMVTALKFSPPFRGLAITRKDRFGRILELELHYGKNGKKRLKASDIRKALGASKLRSTAFTIQGIEGGILFQGRGWGHGVGLCQVGAIEMGKTKIAQDGTSTPGFSALQILNFYYPASQLYRLWK